MLNVLDFKAKTLFLYVCSTIINHEKVFAELTRNNLIAELIKFIKDHFQSLVQSSEMQQLG